MRSSGGRIKDERCPCKRREVLGRSLEVEAEMGEGSTSQGTLGVVGDGQNLEEARTDPPLQVSEGARPCWCLDLGLLASRTPRRAISVALGSVRGTLSPWHGVHNHAAPRGEIWQHAAECAGPSRERCRHKPAGRTGRTKTISLSHPQATRTRPGREGKMCVPGRTAPRHLRKGLRHR